MTIFYIGTVNCEKIFKLILMKVKRLCFFMSNNNLIKHVFYLKGLCLIIIM